MCFDFLNNFSLKYLWFYEEMSEIWFKKMYTGVQGKVPVNNVKF